MRMEKLESQLQAIEPGAVWSSSSLLPWNAFHLTNMHFSSLCSRNHTALWSNAERDAGFFKKVAITGWQKSYALVRWPSVHNFSTLCPGTSRGYQCTPSILTLACSPEPSFLNWPPSPHQQESSINDPELSRIVVAMMTVTHEYIKRKVTTF